MCLARRSCAPSGPDVDLGVVIPVCQGADLLPRSLQGLLDQRSLPVRVSVAVVVNDADSAAHAAARAVAEDHAARMAARGYAYRVLSCPPGRRTALAVGDAALPEGARLFLDQDARLSSHALARLAPLVCGTTQARFVTFALQVTPAPSAAVRLVLRTLLALPYVAAAPVTAGCYGVSAAGHRLWDWDRMPAGVGDDKYVRCLFAPAARHRIATESYEVVAPGSYRSLVAARIRYARMNRALRAVPGLFPDDRRGRGVPRHLLWPGHWPGVALTAATLALAALSSRTRPG